MRVFFFLPDVDAGVAKVTKNIMKFKPSSTAKYFAVLFSERENQSAYPIQDIEGVDEVFRFTYSSKENAYSVYKRMASILKSPDDIIVANDGFEVRMVAALKLPNPLVYILHGDFNYYYSICSLNYGIIDLYISISQKIEKELIRVVPKDHQYKIRQIYFPAAIADGKTEDHQRDNSLLKILFAGTLDARKGAHLLREIYDALVSQIEHFEFHIIGDGPLRDLLNQQFASCNNVLMEGWQPNEYVIEKMKLADIFLFPSSSEGLPNVLIEALHSGAVPVASKLESGVMDIINNGVNGCLVEAGNAKEYADVIIRLNNDRNLLNELRRNGRIGLEKFEPHRQAAVYDQAIKGITSQRTVKEFPNYPMGRWLNRPWLPNIFVKAIRSIVTYPKV